jgi:hypothetical protein
MCQFILGPSLPMPKRTNEFQKIIFLIQKQLEGKALVTESKLLTDFRTGAEVEVDVVIEGSVSGIDIKIGIECIDRSRPATIEWVNQMIQKHNDLPLNKTILVSKSGFSAGALKKAKAYGIEAISFKFAEEADWNEIIRASLMLGHFEFSIVDVYVECEVEKGTSITSIDSNAAIREEGNQNIFTLGTYSQTIIAIPKIGQDVMKKWIELPKDQRKYDFNFKLTINPNVKTSIEYAPSCFGLIKKMDLNARAVVRTTPVSMRTGRYLGRKVAYGTAENIFPESKIQEERLIITLVQDENAPAGQIYVPGHPDPDKQILVLKSLKKEG